MTIRHEPSSWEQLALFPPETIRIEVVVFVDGPTETATVGWKVTDATTDDVIALGVDRPCPMTMALSSSIEQLSLFVNKACATVSPF